MVSRPAESTCGLRLTTGSMTAQAACGLGHYVRPANDLLWTSVPNVMNIGLVFSRNHNEHNDPSNQPMNQQTRVIAVPPGGRKNNIFKLKVKAE